MRRQLDKLNAWLTKRRDKKLSRVMHPFWTIVGKEVGDHVRSWRFIILLALISLTCLGSLYTATMTLVGSSGSTTNDEFFFLKLFTTSDSQTGLPPFITFVSFLGPLLGIGLGFDAVNSERNKGTLSRIMSQPIHRDYLLNAKFTAALIVITILFGALTFLVIGFGLFMLGIPPSPEEFWRIMSFLVLTVFYVGFWLNLSIAFSVRFRQPATSALAGISVWLFFSVFFSLVLNLVGNALMPAEDAVTEDILGYQQSMELLARLSPSQLFSEATTTLLMPSVRTLSSFLTIDQVVGTLPGALPLGQSLLLVWPQITGLAAATMLCFAVSYVMFMRQEIRSR